MTKLEEHLEGIINIFHQYSVRVGNFDTLSKGELKQLITKELANSLKVGRAAGALARPGGRWRDRGGFGSRSRFGSRSSTQGCSPPAARRAPPPSLSNSP